MRAGCDFINLYKDKLPQTKSVKIDLFGSLALTGKGHKTDYAVVLGVMGFYQNQWILNWQKTL